MKTFRAKDLGKSRNSCNHQRAERAVEVILNWGNPFKHKDCLINLCSGIQAPQELLDDVLNAKAIGMKSLTQFVENRIMKSGTSFYNRIKKNKLHTLACLQKKKSIKLKEKTITLSAARAIFARMLVIAKIQEGMSLKLLLTYSLTPITLVFGLADDSLVKTVKSKLLGKKDYFPIQ